MNRARQSIKARVLVMAERTLSPPFVLFRTAAHRTAANLLPPDFGDRSTLAANYREIAGRFFADHKARAAMLRARSAGFMAGAGVGAGVGVTADARILDAAVDKLAAVALVDELVSKAAGENYSADETLKTLATAARALMYAADTNINSAADLQIHLAITFALTAKGLAL